jgi:hypothetical protein
VSKQLLISNRVCENADCHVHHNVPELQLLSTLSNIFENYLLTKSLLSFMAHMFPLLFSVVGFSVNCAPGVSSFLYFIFDGAPPCCFWSSSFSFSFPFNSTYPVNSIAKEIFGPRFIGDDFFLKADIYRRRLFFRVDIYRGRLFF